MATLLPYCLRLTCTITNAGPRLAFSGMTDTLLDGISTRITMHPCFVAHYVINFDYPWMPPLYFVWFVRPTLIIQRRLFYGTSFIATCVHDSPQLCWGVGIVSINRYKRHINYRIINSSTVSPYYSYKYH